MSFNFDADKTMKYFSDLLEKFGTDEKKWVEYMNTCSPEEKSMIFKFDTKVTDGIIIKMFYDITDVEIIINDPEIQEELKKESME